MDKPKTIKYQTPHGEITLWQRSQLITYNGVPCIDAGHIKHNGKNVRFVVRYDDKPELAALVAQWVADWDAYNTWHESEVAATIKRATIRRNIVDAVSDITDGRYEWSWADEHVIRDTATGKTHYNDLNEEMMVFWDAVEIIRNKQTSAPMTMEEQGYADDYVDEPKHGEHGYCRKCHSYCYGDCEAN